MLCSLSSLCSLDFLRFFCRTNTFPRSGVTGLVLAACTVAGTFYIDKVGRRTIWLVGGTATACCHFVLGILYLTGAAHGSVGKWIVVVFLELFAVSFTSSWATVTKLYAAEIQVRPFLPFSAAGTDLFHCTQPSRTRAASASFGQGMNQLVNCGVALSGPFFLDKSSYGPYFMFVLHSSPALAPPER